MNNNELESQAATMSDLHTPTPGVTLEGLASEWVEGVDGIESCISDTKRAIRQSEKSLAEAQKVAHLGSWEWDLVSNKATASLEMFHLLGLEAQDFELGITVETFMDCLHPDDRGWVQQALANTVEKRGSLSYDARIIRSDGTVRLLHALGDVILDEAGQPVRLIGTAQDITENRRVAEGQRTSETRFRALFEHASDSIIIFDDNATYIDVNPAAAEQFHSSREQLIGKRMYDIGDTACQPRVLGLLRDLIHTGSLHAEFDMPEPTGRARSFDYSAVANILPGQHMSIIRDVTARKQAEETILQLAGIVESSNDAIISTNLDGTITTWNSAATALYGYAADEVKGLSLSILLPPDRHEVERHVLARLKQGENVSHFETCWISKDGSEIPISVSISRLLETTGKLAGVSMITRGTATRKQVEDALYRVSQKDVRHRKSIIYGDLAAIFVLTIAIFVLSATLGLFDGTIDFVLDLSNSDGLHDLFSASVFMVLAFVAFSYRRWKELSTQMVARKTAEDALRSLHGDLDLRVQERTIDLAKVNDALRLEIVERQQVEASLRESEQRYRQMFIGNGSIQLLIDPATALIVEANQAAINFYGYSLEELKGMTIADINTSLGEAKVKLLLKQMSHEAMTIVSHHRLASGEFRDIEGYTGPIDIGGRRLIHEIITDITTREQAQAARLAQQAAEQANRAKSEFLSRMSHELRTPLNAILGFGQLLQMDNCTLEQEESVGYILRAGKHLLNLINEVLDISRIEAGKLELSVEPVFLRDIVQESLDFVQTLAANRNITVIADMAWMDNCYVMADRKRLQQVFLNLLANSIKYNREGGTVTVSCSELRPEASEGREHQDALPATGIRVAVSDTGYGLSPEKLAKLFTPFERLGAEQSDTEGTGLGLTLSLHLMQAMGGTIGIESEQGVGSTFWVELSLSDEHMPVLAPAVTGSLIDSQLGADARTILYVEDNLSNLRLIERILMKQPGVTLITAAQGQMGLDMAIAHQPDLILLDLFLPDIQGNEVLRRLRENPRTADIPVIMLTADANPKQVNMLLEAGAQAYLTKPFDVKQLLKAIAKAPVETAV